MPPSRAHRLVPVLLAVAVPALLVGCTAGAPPATSDPAASSAGAAPPSSAAAEAPPAAAGSVCDALPIDQLNPAIEAIGAPAITGKAPEGDGCLLTTSDAEYLLSRTPQTLDEIVDGRAVQDVTAGAKAVWIAEDRTWVQEGGEQRIVAVMRGGSDPANLVDVIALMNPVADALWQ